MSGFSPDAVLCGERLAVGNVTSRDRCAGGVLAAT
jgi:hypothetical protein